MLYLMVTDVPEDRFLPLPGLKTRVLLAYLLADPERKPLAVTTDKHGAAVTFPEGKDPGDSVAVVALVLEHKPNVDR